MTRNGPAVRPERRREEKRPMDLGGALRGKTQCEHHSGRKSPDDYGIAALLQRIVRLLDGLVPVHPSGGIQELVRAAVADEKRTINSVAGAIESLRDEFHFNGSAAQSMDEKNS